MVPLEEVMLETVRFYGPKRKVLAAQLDLNGRRECWTNKKLIMFYTFDMDHLGVEPERLFHEIGNFKKGFDVWV
jgi:hypothetical protein